MGSWLSRVITWVWNILCWSSNIHVVQLFSAGCVVQQQQEEQQQRYQPFTDPKKLFVASFLIHPIPLPILPSRSWRSSMSSIWETKSEVAILARPRWGNTGKTCGKRMEATFFWWCKMQMGFFGFLLVLNSWMLLSVWAIVWLPFRFLIDNNYSNLWKFTNLSRIVRSFWMSASHVAQQENWKDIRIVFSKQTLEHQWASTYFRWVNHPGFFQENRSWGFGG